MSQLNAWEYQPTRTSIFFDLHQHHMRMTRAFEIQMQVFGQLFIDGLVLDSYATRTYEKAIANMENARVRFSDFKIEN